MQRIALTLVAVAALAGTGGSAALATGGDPLAASQWALPTIGAPAAWAMLPQPLASTTVAVVDTGVDAAHPDLAPRMWRSPAGLSAPLTGAPIPAGSTGWDFVDNDADPSPAPYQGPRGESAGTFFAHGTKIAGIIGAERGNDIGVAGVDPSARIMSLRVCTSGPAGCSTTRAARAIDFAAAAGARVVNISVGGSMPNADEEAAINRHPELLFVVSAGNSGRDIDAAQGHWPCAYPVANVICVANLTEAGVLAESSNYGATSVDIAAPGTDILTTGPDGGFMRGTGTSEAAPVVAGVASFLFSAVPTATPTQIREAILTSARPVPGLRGKVATGGIVDLEGAFLRLAPLDQGASPGATRILARVRPVGAPRITRSALSASSRRLTVRVRTGGAVTSWRVTGLAKGRRVLLAKGRSRGENGLAEIAIRLPRTITASAVRVALRSPAGETVREIPVALRGPLSR